MEKEVKVIVAHPAQQHSYRTVIALNNNDKLFKYITTVYDKKKSITMKIIKLFLGKSNMTRANGRKSNLFEDSDVVQFCQIRGFIELLLLRINKKMYQNWSERTTNRFGEKVAKYAIKHNVDVVIMYDTKANKCFELLKNKAPNIKRVLDMSAPNFSYMDKIFKEDILKFPKYSDEVRDEMSELGYVEKIKNSQSEIENADYFFVASEFSKKSLTHYNILENKIYECQYGIDRDYYLPDPTKKIQNNKLNCVFIGRVTEQKGAFHLLETLNLLNSNLISVVFLGDYNPHSQYYQDNKSKYTFLGHVTKDQVVEECQKADLMIFPSLADGFGLSAIEAMACGLPVICSLNAGVSDLVIDGYNGFKFAAGDDSLLKEKLDWCISNKEALKIMGENAYKTCLECGWDKYYESINLAINKMMLS